MFLGIRAVIVKSFARIHRTNLINWGVVPLVLDDPASLAGIERDDRLRLPGLRAALEAGDRVRVENARTGAVFTASCVLTTREREILLAGGILAHTKAGKE
jgi:aconitate hydratase